MGLCPFPVLKPADPPGRSLFECGVRCGTSAVCTESRIVPARGKVAKVVGPVLSIFPDLDPLANSRWVGERTECLTRSRLASAKTRSLAAAAGCSLSRRKYVGQIFWRFTQSSLGVMISQSVTKTCSLAHRVPDQRTRDRNYHNAVVRTSHNLGYAACFSTYPVPTVHDNQGNYNMRLLGRHGFVVRVTHPLPSVSPPLLPGRRASRASNHPHQPVFVIGRAAHRRSQLGQSSLNCNPREIPESCEA